MPNLADLPLQIYELERECQNIQCQLDDPPNPDPVWFRSAQRALAGREAKIRLLERQYENALRGVYRTEPVQVRGVVAA